MASSSSEPTTTTTTTASSEPTTGPRRKLSFSDAVSTAVTALPSRKRGSVKDLVEKFNMSKEQLDALKLVARFPAGTVTENFFRVLLRQSTLVEPTKMFGRQTRGATPRVAYLLSDYLVVVEEAIGGGPINAILEVIDLTRASVNVSKKDRYTLTVTHSGGTFKFQAVSEKDRSQWRTLMEWAIDDSIQRARALELVAKDQSGQGLIDAVREKNAGLIQHLIFLKAEMGFLNSDGLTPLHVAVMEEASDMIDVFAAKNARFDVTDAAQRTAMQLACSTPTVPPAVVVSLAEGGACVKEGMYYATTAKNASATGALLSYGVSPNITYDQHTDSACSSHSSGSDSSSSKTALHYACESGDAATVSVLLGHGAYPCARDREFNTPLHLSSDREVSQLMVYLGARKQLRNAAGHKACTLSLRSRKSGLVQGDGRVCEKSEWVPDAESAACQLCSSEFWFFRRRHHCRRCGVLVCDDCSDQRFSLRAKGAALRSCDSCFNVLTYKITQTAEAKTTVSESGSEHGKASLPKTPIVPRSSDSMTAA